MQVRTQQSNHKLCAFDSCVRAVGGARRSPGNLHLCMISTDGGMDGRNNSNGAVRMMILSKVLRRGQRIGGCRRCGRRSSFTPASGYWLYTQQRRADSPDPKSRYDGDDLRNLWIFPCFWRPTARRNSVCCFTGIHPRGSPTASSLAWERGRDAILR